MAMLAVSRERWANSAPTAAILAVQTARRMPPLIAGVPPTSPRVPAQSVQVGMAGSYLRFDVRDRPAAAGPAVGRWVDLLNTRIAICTISNNQ
jgi:hypothetical protein